MDRDPDRSFLSPACLVTIAALACGLAACHAAIAGRLEIAITWLMAAGVADLFDGPIGRWLSISERQTGYRRQLDTVADGCNFGLTPAVILHSANGFTSPVELATLVLLVVAVVARLAYFGAFGLDRREGEAYYRGLPSTYVAVFVPIAFALRYPLGIDTGQIALLVTLPALSIAMVSPISVPKPRGPLLALFVVLAIGLTWLFLGSSGTAG